MDIQELADKAKNRPREEFKRELSKLARTDTKYRNLDAKNQEFVMDIVYKHIDNIRDGDGISGYLLQQETQRIYSNREKLGISLEDYEDIKEILNLFKK